MALQTSQPTSLHAASRRVVGIGEMAVSSNRHDMLVTYSLGSCVGLALYDPLVAVGGMVHCMLPLSVADPEKAALRPALYTDLGVVKLIEAMLHAGASKSRLIAKVAGAGAPLGDELIFKIGPRNYTVLRKILWKNNILIEGERTGGTRGRTLYLHIGSGRTSVRCGDSEEEF